MSGANTPHDYFYIPDYDGGGPADYLKYKDTRIATDLALFGLEGLGTQISNWIGIQAFQEATYSDASTFTVSDDLTSKYSPGQLLLLNLGIDGLVANIVVSSSYGGGVTTVIVTTANLTSNLAHAQVLNPTRSDEVIAADYGTNQAALESADAVAVAAGKRLVIGISYSITTDCTLSAHIKILPAAILTIATGKTLTINGTLDAGLYQIFSCTGTGKVVFGRPNGVKELVPQWWGATGNGTTDDIIPLQAMVDCSVASGGESGGIDIYIPGGIYKITDTLKLNKGVNYASFIFRGAGGNEGGTACTVFDASSFGDRPAINIQGARNIRLKGFHVTGKNVAPLASFPPDPVKANWITAGCNDTQYAPYAGISIDAYACVAPVGGYSNDTYGRATSSGVFLEDVTVTYFVIGLALSPSSDNSEGDFVSLKDCYLTRCTYGYSGGGSQNDSINFYNTWVYANWCSFTNNTHGAQNGHIPNIWGGGIQDAWKVFECTPGIGAPPFVISGWHAEAFSWLGNITLAKFESCLINWNILSYEPYFFCGTQISFDSCYLSGANNVRETFSFFSLDGTTTFTNCTWVSMANGLIGLINNPLMFGNYQFINCSINSAYPPYYFYPASEYKGSYPTKVFISPWTHTVRLWTVNGYTNYKVTLPYRGFYTDTGVEISSVSIAGTDHNAVLTFTASSADDWKVGDFIMWKVPERTGTYVNNMIPAFKVSNKVGTAITANSLVDNVDVNYSPASAAIVIPLFINGTESTGDTHTNTTVDNVTTISNWAVGDWIQGAGIPKDTRITNIVGTTITLSKAATATAAGVALYNCRLTEIL